MAKKTYSAKKKKGLQDSHFKGRRRGLNVWAKKKTFGQGLTPLHQGPFKMESLTEKGVATIKITKTVVPGRKST